MAARSPFMPPRWQSWSMGSGSRRGWAQLAPEWTLTVSTIRIGGLGTSHEGYEMTLLADRVALVTGPRRGSVPAWPPCWRPRAHGWRLRPGVVSNSSGWRREFAWLAAWRADRHRCADDNSMARLLGCEPCRIRPIDVLVNNAGFGLWTPLEATTIADGSPVCGQRPRRCLPERGCPAQHAGTPLRPRDQHRQRSRYCHRPGHGRLLRQQARPRAP